MSINNLPGRIKFRQTEDTLTNNASLLGLHGLGTRLGLIEDLNSSFPSYSSNRAYRDFKYPYLQILSHAAGGIGIEDTRTISADLPLGRLLFPDQARWFDTHPERTESYFPAPNTLGDWYRNARSLDLHRARKINRTLCAQIINQLGMKHLQIDIDSKMHASNNKKAKRNRDGIKGYAPLYVTLPELKLILDPLFREGNTSPAKHNASMTRTILNWLRGIGLDRVQITIDNAGCQVAVMKSVDRAHHRSDKSIYVYTRPSSPDETLPKKMFKSIEEAGGNWKPIKTYYNNYRTRYRYLTPEEKKQRSKEEEVPPPEILDADYTLSSPNKDWDGRLILIREPVVEDGPQKSFAHGFHYTPVLTNDWESDPIEIVTMYNQRGAGEDAIGEIVQEGEAERFPCQEGVGNGLYLALIAMGHNLDQAMKQVTHQTFQPLSGDSKEETTSQAEGEATESTQVKKPAHQETAQLLSDSADTDTNWLQFTLRKFSHLLLSIPARITNRGGYSFINISSHNPFGKLLEQVIRACWRKTPLLPSKPP